MRADKEKIQPHWWGKSIAGILLGLTLTYGLIGIFAWFGPGGIDANAKVQFNMWMVTPIWLSIITFTYLFRTAVRAFVGLALANLIVFSVYALLRALL